MNTQRPDEIASSSEITPAKKPAVQEQHSALKTPPLAIVTPDAQPLPVPTLSALATPPTAIDPADKDSSALGQVPPAQSLSSSDAFSEPRPTSLFDFDRISSSALRNVPPAPAAHPEGSREPSSDESDDSASRFKPRAQRSLARVFNHSEDKYQQLQSDLATANARLAELEAALKRIKRENLEEVKVHVEQAKNPAVATWIRKLGEIQITAIHGSEEYKYLVQMAELIVQENFEKNEYIQAQLRKVFPQLLNSQNAEQKLKTLAFTIEYYEALDRKVDQDRYNALKTAYENEVKSVPAPGKTADEKETETYNERIVLIQAKHKEYFGIKNTNLVFDCAREIAKTAKPKANATENDRRLLQQLTEIAVIGLVDPINTQNQKRCCELYSDAERIRTTTSDEVRAASAIFYLSLILATVLTAAACAMFFGPMMAGIALSTFNEALAASQAIAAISGYAVATSSFFSVKKAAPTDGFMSAVSKAYSTPTQYGKAVTEYNVANCAYHVTEIQESLHGRKR